MEDVKDVAPERGTEAVASRPAEPLPAVRAMLVIAALAYAGLMQWQVTHGAATLWQLLWFVAAATLFGLAVPESALPCPSLTDPAAPDSRPVLRGDWINVLTALVILAVSLELFWTGRERGAAFVLWWLAMIWFVLSFSARPRLPGRLTLPRGMDALFPASVAIVLLLVAVSTFYRLGSIPVGVWWDEANFGLYAQQILHHTIDFPLLTPFGDASLDFYAHALEQQIFGPTELATRVLEAICGVATVPLIGLLAAALWNRWVGLVAMIVLGFMRWHLDISRFGVHAMIFEFFELAAILSLVLGIRGRRPAWFALCGVLTGLSLHIYSPSYALAGLILLMIAFALILLRPRLSLALAGLVLVGFVLAYTPLLEAGIQHPDLFNSRAAEVSVFGPNNQEPLAAALVHNLRAHALMFNVVGDHNGRHSIPGQPQLDGLSAVLFLLGLAWAVRYAYRPRYALLVLWFLAMMAPAVLSLDFEAPQSLRAVGAQPPVALFITLALCGAGVIVTRALLGAFPRVPWRRPLFAVLLLPVLAIIGVSNVQAYFDAELHNEDVWESWSTDATFVGYHARTLPADDLIYISPELAGHPTIQYLAPGRSATSSLDPSLDLPFRAKSPVAVFLTRDDGFYFPLLEAYYPHGTFRVLRGPNPAVSPLTYEARLSRRDVTGVQGLSLSYEAGGQILHRRVAALAFPPHLPASLFVAVWRGGVAIPAYGPATLAVRAPEDRITVLVDGRRRCSGLSLARCTAVWPRGNHGLAVRLTGRQSTYLRWSWSGTGTPTFFDSPLMGRGLPADYYANGSWSGRPTFVQMEPQVDYYYQNLPLQRPFTVRWQGSIQIPTAGRYEFALDSINDSWLTIDGSEILHAYPGYTGPAPLTLRPGWHRIVVRLSAVTDFTHIYLTWQPPGALAFEPIPMARFRP